MKNLPLLLAFFISVAFAFLACNSDRENSHTKDTAGNIFEEKSESKFEILDKKEDTGYTYKTVESSFRDVQIQLVKFDERRYFAHLETTTKKSTGLEGQERNIKVKIRAFDKPAENVVEINQDCDDIDLQNFTYRTAKYGCCGALNHYEIFDYANKKIIEGDGNILTGSIPNSRLIIYAAFVKETKDSTSFGTLYYSTTQSERFSIKIKGKPASVAACPDFMPEILFVTDNKRDVFDDTQNTYTFWSFDQIEKPELITNLTIRFKIECSEELNLKVLTIPIVNGKPLGKEDKVQEMKLN